MTAFSSTHFLLFTSSKNNFRDNICWHKLRIRFGAKEHTYSLSVYVKVTRRSSPNRGRMEVGRAVKILVLLLTKYMVMGI